MAQIVKTIDELAQEKRKIEFEFKERLRSFEEEFGVIVQDVDTDHVQVLGFENELVVVRLSVRIK